MRFNRFCRIAVITVFFLATRANASPIFVDFTSAASWGGADGQAGYSLVQGTVEVGLSVLSGGTLTFNADDAPLPTGETDFLALDGDGIGIGDDEIGSGETLGVSFSSPVTVLSLVMLDLHTGEGPGGASEQLLADFGAAGTYSGSASGADTSGYFANFDLAFADVSSFTLSSFGDSWSDSALAGIWFDDGNLSVLNLLADGPVSVPEPGTLLLLGSGLFVMGVSRERRRQSRANS